jgi:hypothetical protein
LPPDDRTPPPEEKPLPPDDPFPATADPVIVNAATRDIRYQRIAIVTGQPRNEAVGLDRCNS